MELDELEILNCNSTFFVEWVNCIHFFLFQKPFAARTHKPKQIEIKVEYEK